MKKTNTVKTIFTLFLGVMLITVQCLGAVAVNAEDVSVSYTFDEWTPVPVTDTEGAVVEGAYRPPTGWTSVSTKFSATNYYYKEDGAMGYSYTPSTTQYNTGLKTDIPSGIDKNDFYIDYALYRKKGVFEAKIATYDSGGSISSLNNQGTSVKTKVWQQFSVRFKKNDSNKYTVSIYTDGSLSEQLNDKSLYTAKFGLVTTLYGGNSMNVLLDNVNIRNTPATLSVTPSVANGAQNVATDAALTYALSQDIDSSTLSSVTIKDSNDNAVEANAEYDYRTKTITLRPALSLNTTYTVDFSNVKDVIGNSAETNSYTFTTAKEKVYVNETFDSYSDGTDFPKSGMGTWSYNESMSNLTMSGGDGTFTFAHKNTGSSSVYPEMKFSLNSSVSNAKLLFEIDYNVISGGGCVIKLNDTATSKNLYTQWNSGSKKLQAVIDGSSAKVYINGVYKNEVTLSGWKEKVGAIIVSPIVYGKATTKIAIDNIRLSTLPVELNVTSSLDVNNKGLSLGEDISFTFDNAINKDTVETATVKANGTAVGEAVYNAATKTITFAYDTATPLVENTTYTVDLSGVRDIYGNAPKTTSYTFKTVEKAGVSIDEASFSVKEGSVDVTTDGFLGGTVTATVNAVNTSLADSKVMVAIAMYNNDFSNLKAISTEIVTIPSNGTLTPVSATLTPGDKYSAGDCIKVFVLDSSTLKPFRLALTVNEDGELTD